MLGLQSGLPDGSDPSGAGAGGGARDGAGAAEGAAVEIDFENGLMDTPPGWAEGIVFSKATSHSTSGGDAASAAILGASDDGVGGGGGGASSGGGKGSGGSTNLISFSTLIDVDSEDEAEAEQAAAAAATAVAEEAAAAAAEQDAAAENDIEAVLAAPARDGGRQGRRGDGGKSKTWAVVENSSMENFHSMVPEMARTWPVNIPPSSTPPPIYPLQHSI